MLQSLQKEQIRSDAKKRIKLYINEMSAEQKKQLDKKICNNIISFISTTNTSKTIASFIATRYEPNIESCMQFLAEARNIIGVPKINGDYLVFREWQQNNLVPHQLFKTIMEPTDACPLITPDIVLLPLVAADMHGNRLGKGKGYYDRTLARLRAENRTAICVGICFDMQIIDLENCLSPYDQKLDYIITERMAYCL